MNTTTAALFVAGLVLLIELVKPQWLQAIERTLGGLGDKTLPNSKHVEVSMSVFNAGFVGIMLGCGFAFLERWTLSEYCFQIGSLQGGAGLAWAILCKLNEVLDSWVEKKGGWMSILYVPEKPPDLDTCLKSEFVGANWDDGRSAEQRITSHMPG